MAPSLRESLQSYKDKLIACQSEMETQKAEIQKWRSAFQNELAISTGTYPDPGSVVDYIRSLKTSEESLRKSFEEKISNAKKERYAIFEYLYSKELEIAELKDRCRELSMQKWGDSLNDAHPRCDQSSDERDLGPVSREQPFERLPPRYAETEESSCNGLPEVSSQPDPSAEFIQISKAAWHNFEALVLELQDKAFGLNSRLLKLESHFDAVEEKAEKIFRRKAILKGLIKEDNGEGSCDEHEVIAHIQAKLRKKSKKKPRRSRSYWLGKE